MDVVIRPYLTNTLYCQTICKFFLIVISKGESLFSVEEFWFITLWTPKKLNMVLLCMWLFCIQKKTKGEMHSLQVFAHWFHVCFSVRLTDGHGTVGLCYHLWLCPFCFSNRFWFCSSQWPAYRLHWMKYLLFFAFFSHRLSHCTSSNTPTFLWFSVPSFTSLLTLWESSYSKIPDSDHSIS